MGKRYKILFISSWFPNKIEPTNGNFVQRHAEAVALLHDVQIIHAIGDSNQKEKYLLTEDIKNGIITVIVYYKNSNSGFINFYRRMKSYAIAFNKVDKPNLIHANILHNNLLFVWYLKWFRNIPFVVTEHWSAFLKDNISKTSFSKKITARFIGNSAEYILPVSYNLQQGLQTLNFSVPFELVNNVVDTEVFTIEDNAHQNIHFLHISNLIDIKNPFLILRTFIRLRREGYPIFLSIGGDGDIKPLQEILEEYNMHEYCDIFGEISSKEVAEKMKKSDYFVLLSSYENQPCVLIESMACGKPVIATNVGGIPEIVKEGFGVLVNVNDEEDSYQKIKSVIEKKITFKAPHEIRNYAETNFSKENVAKRFSEIYSSILERK